MQEVGKESGEEGDNAKLRAQSWCKFANGPPPRSILGYFACVYIHDSRAIPGSHTTTTVYSLYFSLLNP